MVCDWLTNAGKGLCPIHDSADFMGLKARKAAEDAEKQRMKAEANMRKHLLVKMGADRNVREAYLYGVGDNETFRH